MPLDEWDLARADLNLPSISSADLSVDGSQTFSFTQPTDFELKYDEDEIFPEAVLKERGETESVLLKSVTDPTMRFVRDWCHVKFLGSVSLFLISGLLTFGAF